MPGLWSELRFRLRRRLGVLTGTIDKLLITPAENGDGFDVEIVDFKTNRFRSTSKSAAAVARTARPLGSSGPKSQTGSAQVAFDFEGFDHGEPELTVTLESEVERTARDYQLQLQSYALALRELLPRDVKVSRLRATLHFIDPDLEATIPDVLLDKTRSAEAIDEAMLAIASLEGVLDPEQFPPLTASHCRICNFVELCPAGKEWLSKGKSKRSTPGTPSQELSIKDS